MRFARPAPRRTAQDRAIVPMINVVFLLLIFFLMTASLTPQPPFELDPPLADGPAADPPPGVLHIAADGRLAYGAARDTAVFAAVAGRGLDTPLPIRADAALPATDLARLLPQLGEAGVAEVSLLTVRP